MPLKCQVWEILGTQGHNIAMMYLQSARLRPFAAKRLPWQADLPALSYYILSRECPWAQDKSLGRRSWALPKTCNFRSWALSWAQSTKNDTSTLTTFLSGLVPKTSDTPLERFNHLNYFETWSMPVRPCCLTAGIVVRRLLCEAIK